MNDRSPEPAEDGAVRRFSDRRPRPESDAWLSTTDGAVRFSSVRRMLVVPAADNGYVSTWAVALDLGDAMPAGMRADQRDEWRRQLPRLRGTYSTRDGARAQIDAMLAALAGVDN